MITSTHGTTIYTKKAIAVAFYGGLYEVWGDSIPYTVSISQSVVLVNCPTRFFANFWNCSIFTSIIANLQGVAMSIS